MNTEIYDHVNDDGPPDPGEGDPYPHPRRRSAARPATLVAAFAGVLAVAFAIGGVAFLLSSRQSSDTARPLAHISSVTPRPRPHPRPTHKPAPSARHSPKPSARHSPKPAARKPVARDATPAPAPVRQAAAAPLIVRTMTPPPPPLTTAPAKPPVTVAPVNHQISGYVQCSTMAVAGIWIVAKQGGSGWAKWAAFDSSSTARYTYSLPNGGQYAVHVGCGGSPAHWLTTPYSKVVSGTFNDFICYDVAGQPAYDFCSHIN
jgi:hypothetical protein